MKQVNLKTFEVGDQLEKTHTNLYGNYFYMFPADDKVYMVWYDGTTFGFSECLNYGMGTCSNVGNTYNSFLGKPFQELRVQVRGYASEDSYAQYQRHALCFLTFDSAPSPDVYKLYCGICAYDLGGCKTGEFKHMVDFDSTTDDFNVGFAYSSIFVVFDDGNDSSDSSSRDQYEYSQSLNFTLVSYAKVSNIPSNKHLIVAATYGYAYQIDLDDQSKTKVLATTPASNAGSVANHPDFYPKLVHEFDTSDNLSVSYAVRIEGNSIVGISFNTDPWLHLENVNSATMSNAARKVNIISGTSYISMNDVIAYDSLINYTRSTTGDVAINQLCGSSQFYIKVAGTFKQCLTACPSYLPKYKLEANLERECVETCTGPYSDIQDSNACLLVSCSSYPSSTYKFWGTSAGTECTKSCHGANLYLDGITCKTECPSGGNKFISSINNFNTGTEYGTCISTCNDPNFQLEDTSFKYPSTNQKYYCSSDCSIFGLNYFYKDGSVNKCTDTCGNQSSSSGVPDALAYLDGTECKAECPSGGNKFISTVANFNTGTEYGTCISTCNDPNFQLEDTSLKYPSTNQKYYCDASCSTFSYSYFFISGAFKKCADTCGNQSSTSGVPDTLAYLDGAECKEECPAGGNKFISSINNFNTGTEYGTCISTCNGSNIRLEDAAFKYTPSNNQKYYCSSDCSIFGLNYFYKDGSVNKCTDTCGNQSSSSGVPDTLAYLDGTECKAECPSGGNKFISTVANFNTGTEYGTCISTCNDPNFQLEDTSLKYPSTNQKYYCDASCSSFGVALFCKIGSINKCTDICGNQSSTYGIPNSYAYLDGTECKEECPAGGNKFISSINNFNTGTEYGTCISTCNDPNFQLEDTSLKYPSTNQKYYCDASCSTFSYSYFYKDGSVNKCTDTCGNQSSSSGVPDTLAYLDGTECKAECPSGGNKFISTVANFNTGTEYGTCISTCNDPNFQLEDTSLKYPSTNQKYYCDASCSTFSYSYFFISGAFKKCADTCGNQSSTSGVPDTLAYLDGAECKEECPAGGNKFISSINNFNTGTEYGTCISTCNGSNIRLEDAAFKYTPSNNQKYYCSSDCSIFGLNYFYKDGSVNKCTDTCGNQSSSSGVPDTLAYLDGTECKAECPSGGNKFISSINNFNTGTEYGTCISTCNDPNFQLEDTSLKYPSTNQKYYCDASCSSFGVALFCKIGSINKCTDICGNQSSTYGIPNSYAYLDGTECKEECPAGGNKFISSINNFNTGTEYGTCISTCNDPNFQLEDTSLKYPSTNQKYYCDASCSTFSYSYFYKDGSVNKCTDTCGNQSSSSGVPDTLAYLDGTECKAECPSGGNKFISTVANFNTGTEYGTCISTCNDPNFQLEDTSLKYPSTNQKYYCDASCSTFSYSYFFISGAFKKCADTCGNQSSTSGVPDTLAYLDGAECKEECPAGGNKFISSINNFNTGTEYGTCISTCNGSNIRLEDTSLKYASTNQKYYCSSSCSTFGLNYFFMSGSVKKCTDTCGNQSSSSGVPDALAYLDETECKEECPAGGNKFISSINNFNTGTEYGTCISTCNGSNIQLEDTSLKYASTNQKYYCSSDCSIFGLNYFYKDGSINKCTDTCGNQSSTSGVPDALAYLDGTECKAECPSGGNKFISTVANFNTGTEYGTCVSTCNDPNFQLEDTTFKYPSTNQKYYCSTTCSIFGLNYFYKIGSINKCTDTCGNQSSTSGVPDALAYLDGTECKAECPAGGNKFISSINNFNTGTEYGTCISTCNDPNFQLEDTSLKYPSTNQKYYCDASCSTFSYSYFFISGSINKCTDTCGNQSSSSGVPDTLAYLDGAECKAECPSGGNKFISTVANFNTGTEYGTCISTCNGSNIRLEDTSLKYASTNQKYYCSSSCSTFGLNYFFMSGSVKKCTDTCGNQSSSSGVPDTLAYLDGTECKAQCPSGGNKFISSINNFNTGTEYGTCISTCNDPNFQLEDTSLKYPSTNQKYYCSSDCSIFGLNYFYKIGSINKCTDTCGNQSSSSGVPDTLAYLDGTECKAECPSGGNKFISSINNFNTGTEYGTCISTCNDPNFQLEDTSLKYPSTNQKYYCSTTCSIFGLNYFYKIGSINKCTDTCGNQSSTSGVPDALAYLDGTECKAECPSGGNKFISSINNFNTGTEYGTCISTCNDPNFQLEDTSLKYPSTNQKYYCDASCSTFSYSYFFISGAFKKCADTCGNQSSSSGVPDTLAYLDGTECKEECPAGGNKFISTVANFNTGTEYGTCISTCNDPNFQLSSSDYEYSVGVPKYYCLSSCDRDSYLKYYVSGSANYCVDDCRDEHATNTMIPGRRYRVTQGAMELCSATCPTTHLTQVRQWQESDEDALCASSCSSSEFVLHNTSFPKIYCLTACDKGSFTKEFTNGGLTYCTHSCLSEIASPDITVISNVRYHYTDSGRTYCASRCPSTHQYIDSAQGFDQPTEYGECVSLCDDPKFRLSNASLVYSDDSPKHYCNNNCTLGDFQFQYSSGGINYCTDSCTSPLNPNHRYQFTDDLGQKFCLSKCPITVKDVENFNTTQEHGICESDCNQFTFESNSYKWADNSLKTFCVPKCNTLVETHPFMTDDRRCVDSCQSAGYLFTLDSNFCSDSCSDFILNNTYCVKECPDDLPLSENQYCTRKCSQANPFIEDFKFCVEKCPLLAFHEFCVDDCYDEILIGYLSSQNRPYTALPFILSTKKCALACSEVDYPFINELSNECMASCPPVCIEPPCSSRKLKYRDAEFYCRQTCNNPVFPFTDEESLECLSECKPERPFLFEDNCLEKCPKSHALIAKEPTCEDKSCESECTNFNLRCVDKCPPSLPFKLTIGELSECVCKCPTFFKPEEKECILSCEPSFGLIPTEDERSCNHCYNDLGRTFFYEGECIVSCPIGTSFNQYYVCTPCKTLNLWTNEDGVCIPFSRCHRLSYFDVENKICTACNSEGYMITKKGPVLACEKTDCHDGFIYELSRQSICIICNKNQFYSEPDCTDLCSEELNYNFQTKRRCSPCSSVCSCCVNGRCRSNICQCEDGWTGRYCTIEKVQEVETVDSIIEFLSKRIRTGFLTKNENILILEVISLFDAQDERRSLKIDNNKILSFMKNIHTLLINQYREYSYQFEIFDTLDKLLALSKMYLSKTSDRSMLDKALEFLYDSSNKIQIFNVTMSVIPDFEQFTSGEFEGSTFSLYFGTDVTNDSQIDLTKCLNRVAESFDLSPTHKFPYRMLKMKQTLSMIEPNENSFVASKRPLIMLWLYLNTGPIDISIVCEEKFIDLKYEVELPDEETQSINQKINITGINVFNKQDPFFNDRCIPASDGTDLTIAKRKSKFFVDSSEICEETINQICQIQNVDQNNKAKCVCKGIQNKKKSTLESAFSSYPKSNYILVTCLSIFKKAVLSENIGFYTIIVPSLLALLLIFYFNPKIDNDLTDENRFKYMRTDIAIYDPNCMEADIYFEECYNLKYKMANQIAQEIDSKFCFESLPTLPDLDELSIAEQFIYDRRSNWRYAKDVIVSYNTLCYTLFSNSLLDPKPFLILLYISELNMGVMLNSFFIDDDLVDNFNESEDHSLLASFASELPKTLWAMLTAKILMGILNVFYSFKARPIRILLKRLMLTKDESAVKAYNLFLNDHTLRLLGLTLVAIPFNLFCMYFVVIYSEIYSNSMGIWLNGIIMGLIIDNLVIEGFPAVSLIITRALARRFPSLEFLFRIVLKVKSLSSLEILG